MEEQREERNQTKLRESWRLATDEDVIKMAFAGRHDISPAALVIVFQEFIRRGLPVLERPEEPPAPPPASLSRRHPFFMGLLVLALADYIWFAVVSIIRTGFLPPLPASLIPSIMLLLPPGFLALAYVVRSLRGFQPDPEGLTRCGHCGYALRGLTEPRCPECGHAF